MPPKEGMAKPRKSAEKNDIEPSWLATHPPLLPRDESTSSSPEKTNDGSSSSSKSLIRTRPTLFPFKNKSPSKKSVVVDKDINLEDFKNLTMLANLEEPKSQTKLPLSEDPSLNSDIQQNASTYTHHPSLSVPDIETIDAMIDNMSDIHVKRGGAKTP